MTLTKAKTDSAMLNSVSNSAKHTGELDMEIYTRNTSSSHPIDCQCEVCKALRHKSAGVNEKSVKEELNYFVGDEKE